MNQQWTAAEHHRLHCVEEWPDSQYKRTVIAAIRGRLESLARGQAAAEERWVCLECVANMEREKRLRVARIAA